MSEPRGARAVDAGVALGLVVVTSAVLAFYALSVYDFFDMSAFMDAGYRVYSGQRPYVDFYYIGGPVHLYLHALFYTLFGFTETAVIAHMLAGNLVIVGVTWALARRSLSRAESVLLVLLASLSFYGPIAHPWYDQNATAFIVLGVLGLEARVSAPRAAAVRGAVIGALAGLAFLTKANVGLGGGAVLFATLLLLPWPGWSVAGYAVGLAVGLGAPLLTIAVPDFVYQNFFAWKPSGRLTDLRKLSTVLWHTPYGFVLGMLAALASLGGRAWIARNLPRLVLVSGLVLASIFAAWTGSMIVPANILLVGIELTYVLVLARSLPDGPPGSPERRLSRTAVGAVVLTALVLLLSAGNKMTTHLVWQWHPSNMDNDYLLETAGFRGWQTNPRIGAGVDQAVRAIETLVPRADRLLVFPDATVIYGMTGRTSYRGAPWLFHLGAMPAPGPLYERFRATMRESPPDWILIHEQTEVKFVNTGLLLRWLQLDDFVARRYETAWAWGDFRLLRLRRRAAD